MAARDYVLYDTANLADAANVDHVLFQTVEGATPTAGTPFTNMRGNGQLPPAERFEFSKIQAIIDYPILLADVQAILYQSYISVEKQQKRLLIAPLAMFIASSAYGGTLEPASPADETVIGLIGDGFMLKENIVLSDGVPFRVVLHQGLALTAAASYVKVALIGMLDDKS